MTRQMPLDADAAPGRMSDHFGRQDEVEDDAALGAMLADEIANRFDLPIDRSVIHSEVLAALKDLRGEISRESLPEMAGRLAVFRLFAAVQSTSEPFGDQRF